MFRHREAPIDRTFKTVKLFAVLGMSDGWGYQTGLWFFIKDRQQGLEKNLVNSDIRVNDQDMTGSLLEGERDTEVVAAGKAEVFGGFNKTNTGQFFFDGCRRLSARGIVDTDDFTTFREVGLKQRFNAVNSIEVAAVV